MLRKKYERIHAELLKEIMFGIIWIRIRKKGETFVLEISVTTMNNEKKKKRHGGWLQAVQVCR